jgi:hypothetical protein
VTSLNEKAGSIGSNAWGTTLKMLSKYFSPAASSLQLICLE